MQHFKKFKENFQFSFYTEELKNCEAKIIIIIKSSKYVRLKLDTKMKVSYYTDRFPIKMDFELKFFCDF